MFVHTRRNNTDVYYYGVSDFQIRVDGKIHMMWPSTADRPDDGEILDESLVRAVDMRCFNQSGLAQQIKRHRGSQKGVVIIDDSREFPELRHYTTDE